MTYWFVELLNGQKSSLTDSHRKSVLLKVEGELKPQTSVNFLGRTLKHNGDSIDESMNTAYVTDLLKLCGMENSKPSPTTGASTVSKIQPEPLDRNERKRYRAIVGKLLWLALIRPDIAYMPLRSCQEILLHQPLKVSLK